ncbi:MAG: DUF3047 domain-containing protein [Rhodospirillales bacterium]
MIARSSLRWLCAVCLAIAALTSAGAADILTLDADWKQIDVPGHPAAEISLRDDGLARLVSAGGVSFFYRPVRLSATDSLTASWRWRVEGNFPPSDLTRQGGDERPLALHLWFDHPDSREPLFGTLARAYGYPRVTHVLTYVFGGDGQGGTSFINPYFSAGKVVVLRSGDLANGVWFDEVRDLQADIRRAFAGYVDHRHLRFVALSADNDDLGGQSTGEIRDLYFGPELPDQGASQ